MESSLSSSEIIIFAATGILIMVALALVMVSYSNRAKRNILTQRMEAQTQQLQHQQDLLEGNLMVQEAERQRIAAQLHDDVCSKLGVLHLTFHRLRRTQPDHKMYAEMCQEIDGLIGVTLETTRQISHELVPPTLEDFGLLEALKELCDQIRNTGTVDIEFKHNVSRAEIGDVNRELNIFRIVQELANNTLKYAGASLIRVNLNKEHDTISLQYADNGAGFDLGNIRSRGLGLKNVENRAKMIKANTAIHTAPGQGFEMLFTFKRVGLNYDSFDSND